MCVHEMMQFATAWYYIHLIILSLNLIFLVTAIFFVQLTRTNNLLRPDRIDHKNVLLYRHEQNRLLVSVNKINDIFGSILFGCLLAYTPTNALALMILTAKSVTKIHFYFILIALSLQFTFIFGVHLLGLMFTQMLTAKQSTLYHYHVRTNRFQKPNKQILTSLELNRIVNQKLDGITYRFGHRSIGLVSIATFGEVNIDFVHDSYLAKLITFIEFHSI